MQEPRRGRIVPGERLFGQAVAVLGEAFQHHGVTVFAGAGVSRPSGLPDSRALVLGLVDAMAQSLSLTQIGTEGDRDAVCSILRTNPLERLLDSLVSVLGDGVALDYLSVLGAAPVNYNHEAVAELARRGWLSGIVTLNFDVLFEQALRKQSLPFAWHLPLAGGSDAPRVPAQVTVVKLHGTLPLDGLFYNHDYLAATLQYAGDRPQPETQGVLEDWARNCPTLVVAGYSDNDWDIFPALARMPWSHVVWCEYASKGGSDDGPPPGPSSRVASWLEGRSQGSTFLLYGDVRDLWSAVLEDGQVGRNWPHAPARRPDVSVLLRRPVHTSLAAILLLDATDNQLYRRLLPTIGTLPGLATDALLRRRWERSISWLHHAYRRDPRRAIRMRLDLIAQRDVPGEGPLDYLRDLRSLYYEYVSAAKRPWVNPLLFAVDLVRARRTSRVLRMEAEKLMQQSSVSPRVRKEVERLVAQLEQYRVDLWHNWGYHLLPFCSWPARAMTRKLFRRIARQYAEVARRFPVLDWEYFCVRHAEASLIAGDLKAASELRLRFPEMADMFERTRSGGHLAYLRSIEAIMDDSVAEFSRAEAVLFQSKSGSTPAGKLRMRLLRRYFWPSSLTLSEALRDLVRYSRVQR